MAVALVCFSFLGLYFIFTKLFKVGSESGFFLAFSSLIFALYWSAYFGFLFYGARAIIFSGILGWLLLPFIICREKNILYSKYITPCFVVTLGYAVLLSWLSRHLYLIHIDEFAHWGSHAKYVFLHNGFIHAKDATGEHSYPPGSALFYYLFYLVHGFSESKSYIAQQLLILSAVPLALKDIRWKDWPLTFIGFSLIPVIFKLFDTRLGFEGNLCMDSLAGIFFGGAIIFYKLSDRKCPDILWLIFPVCALSLFKLKLFPLVMVITVIIFVDQILLGWFNYRQSALGSRFLKFVYSRRALILKRFGSILLIPLASLLTLAGWSHYLTKAKIPMEWGLHPSKRQIIDIILGRHLSHREVLTLIHFRHLLVSNVMPIVVGAFIFITLTLLLLKEKKEKITFTLTNLIMFCALCAYVFGLLLMYLFSFSAYEGVMLASFERYAGIFYLAWYFFLFAFLFQTLKQYRFMKSRFLQWPVMIFLALGLFIAAFCHYHHTRRKDIIVRSVWTLRQQIQMIANRAKAYIQPTDRIYTVWQNSAGYSATIIMYEMIPAYAVSSCSGFAEKPVKGDVWSCSWTPEQFLNALKSYNYLLLGYTDKEFWTMYGGLFPKNHAHLKPLVKYQICLTKGAYHPVRAHGCKLETENAYLFKIVRKNGQLRFVNVM